MSIDDELMSQVKAAGGDIPNMYGRGAKNMAQPTPRATLFPSDWLAANRELRIALFNNSDVLQKLMELIEKAIQTNITSLKAAPLDKVEKIQGYVLGLEETLKYLKYLRDYQTGENKQEE